MRYSHKCHRRPKTWKTRGTVRGPVIKRRLMNFKKTELYSTPRQRLFVSSSSELNVVDTDVTFVTCAMLSSCGPRSGVPGPVSGCSSDPVRDMMMCPPDRPGHRCSWRVTLLLTVYLTSAPVVQGLCIVSAYSPCSTGVLYWNY